jgi:hypothetical protein
LSHGLVMVFRKKRGEERPWGITRKLQETSEKVFHGASRHLITK